METHERVWEQPVQVWKPLGTYILLGIMGGVFLLEQMMLGNERRFVELFVVATDWPARPWSPITSTFAHDPFRMSHLLINGLMLYFFGPTLERFIGRRDLIILFVVAGVASGIAQVEISAAWGDGGGALGASGAIMMVFGTLATLMPKQKVLLFFIIPVPFWGAAVGYAALDILGAIGPANGIGNIAHLTGMAMGVLFALALKQQSRANARDMARGF